MFDGIEVIELSSSSDSEEDDRPLSQWQATKTSATTPIQSSATSDSMVLDPEKWPKIDGEGEELTGDAYVARAYKFQERAKHIFEAEKKRITNHPLVSDVHKKHMEPYTMIFDKGTRRRGVCKYPRAGRSGIIGLSARMVNGGTSADKITQVIRHELSHACNPGMKHNATWKRFDLLIGGDGKRCCNDEEVRNIIGHRIEVVCPIGGADHFLKKMQKLHKKK